MNKSINLPVHLTGLTAPEVLASAKLHGKNMQEEFAGSSGWKIFLDLLKEPMLILLMAVTAIYFILGQYHEAFFMLGAILIVTGISFYQDNRSRIALKAIRELNAPSSRVIRDSVLQSIPTSEIVPGDLVLVDEGGLINADGIVVYSHDFSVNESSLTGEANSVYKSEHTENNELYSGTLVSSGMAVFRVNATGSKTKLGQLGRSLSDIEDEQSPLHLQIQSFVRKMSIAGFSVFILVWVVSFIKTNQWLDALLNALTLAMALVPEEIPVAFATFMALGSRRLIRDGILVKKTRVVETLGGATVICSDKTGTITENRMTLEVIYSYTDDQLHHNPEQLNPAAAAVVEAAMWASEPVPFDPMEKTLHEAYEQSTAIDKRRDFTMFHEYPLDGVPPMMTHIFEDKNGVRIIAAKGAPEAIIQVCGLSAGDKKKIHRIIVDLASKGYRILGVSKTEYVASFPAKQQDIEFRFCGLVAFYDPPKKNIREVFDQFYAAGVDVKIITGDNAVTTKAIAEKAGLRNTADIINGYELLQMNQEEQLQTVRKASIFTRMFPEVKLAVIKALRTNHQVVAMIGDGVNDGPALKAADIGIAMGKKGTEIAKSAADLILLEDDLGKLVQAIAAGRRIYTNLKKAVQYIISIHIPIITTVSLPLFLGWVYPNIFTPVHVIFLELIMGPTCSIVYENEPLEKNAMLQPPRPASYSFLNWHEMGQCITQGIIIATGALFVYQYSVRAGGNEELTRTMVFVTLILSNIFLTLVNRSFHYSILESMKTRNPLITWIIALTLIILSGMLFIPVIRKFFHLVLMPGPFFLICLATSFIAVFWFEVLKWFRRSAAQKHLSVKAI